MGKARLCAAPIRVAQVDNSAGPLRNDHTQIASVRGDTEAVRDPHGISSSKDGLDQRRGRPRRCSRTSTKSSPPSGRPVLAWACSASARSAVSVSPRKRRQSDRSSKRGSTRTSSSSSPAKCARALDHSQSSGRSQRWARTGLRSTYLAAAIKWRSSIAKEWNRSCHQCPRQSSRKLIMRV